MLSRFRCVVRRVPLYSLNIGKTHGGSNVPLTHNLWQLRKIHSSRPNAAPLPFLLVFIRPLQLTAMLIGRTMRKRWQRLSPEERNRILQRIRGKQTQIAAGVMMLTGIGLFYYADHIEEAPLTKRKRFILYNDQQMDIIAAIEFANQVEMHKAEIVPPGNCMYNRVCRVANKILEANKSLSIIATKTWAVTLIDRPDIANALVLPNGKILIYTGILNVASNDDQLAVVLSHEIAHTVLQHMAENLSKKIYVDVLFLVPLIILWTLLPDVSALFSQWLSSTLTNIMIHLPFSRSIEREADVVGLELMAKACYDVREAPVFWGKMGEMTDKTTEPLEWLSTHPTNETRQLELSKLVPAALTIRSNCSCPRLWFTSFAQRKYIISEDTKKVSAR